MKNVIYIWYIYFASLVLINMLQEVLWYDVSLWKFIMLITIMNSQKKKKIVSLATPWWCFLFPKLYLIHTIYIMDKSSIIEAIQACENLPKRQYWWKKIKKKYALFINIFSIRLFLENYPSVFVFSFAYTIFSSSSIIYVRMIKKLLTNFDFSINFKSFLPTFCSGR